MWKIVSSIFALLVLVFAVVYQVNYREKEALYNAASMGLRGGDFQLKSGDKEISLRDFSDKVTILYFGFASCPDVCPMALSYLNGVLQKFPHSEDTQVVFVSVDHKRDTPKSVDKYAKYFNQNFIGATGPKEEIDQITKNYGVYYKFIDMKDSEMGYTVDHTSRFFIIDQQGRLQKAIPSAEDPKAFRQALSEVFKSQTQESDA